jgi:hypothetical protein
LKISPSITGSLPEKFVADFIEARFPQKTFTPHAVARGRSSGEIRSLQEAVLLRSKPAIRVGLPPPNFMIVLRKSHGPGGKHPGVNPVLSDSAPAADYRAMQKKNIPRAQAAAAPGSCSPIQKFLVRPASL